MELPRSIFRLLVIIGLFSYGWTQGEDQEQFAEFAEHLADFVPTESFEFRIKATQQQNFIFWPQPQTDYIRGIFYITSEENGGLFFGCQSDGDLKKSFYNKKIGVFKVPYERTGEMKLIFKSQIHNLTIYISYEFVLRKMAIQKQKLDDKPTSELEGIRLKFEKVQKSVFGQQAILDGIIRSQMADERRIADQINTKALKVIVETVVVIVSGFVSIWMLKKQFKEGQFII